MAEINPYKYFKQFSIVPNPLMERPELSPGAKLAYGRLCQYAGENGFAFPTIETLAVALGVKKRQASNYVAELVRYKLVRVKSRKHEMKPNLFKFLDHEWLHTDTTCNKLHEPSCKIVHEANAISCMTLMQESASPSCKKVHVEENQGKDSGEENKGKEPEQPAEADASADCYGPFIPKPNIFTRVPETDFTEEEQLDEEGKAALAAFAEEQAAEQVAFDAKLRAEFNAQCHPLAFVIPPGLEQMPSVWMSSQELMAHLVHDPGPVGELMNKQTLEALERLKLATAKVSEKTNAEFKRQSIRNQKRLEAQQRKYEEDPNAKGIEPKYQVPVKQFLALWYSEFEKKFPSVVQTKYVPGAKGFGKERGQAQDMFRRFDTEDVLRGVKYLIQNWDAIKPRFFKGSATHPTIGMLKTFDAQLIPEAKTMMTAFEAKAAYDKWNSENSNPFKMPVEIRDSYEKAKKVLTAIGVK